MEPYDVVIKFENMYINKQKTIENMKLWEWGGIMQVIVLS